jgi:hypothetical protein
MEILRAFTTLDSPKVTYTTYAKWTVLSGLCTQIDGVLYHHVDGGDRCFPKVYFSAGLRT